MWRHVTKSLSFQMQDLKSSYDHFYFTFFDIMVHLRVKSSNHFVRNQQCSHKKSQEIIRNHVKPSWDFSRRFTISTRRGFEIVWNHIEIVCQWFESYEVHWNHLKLCAVDDIINFWNHWNHSCSRLKSGTHHVLYVLELKKGKKSHLPFYL